MYIFSIIVSIIIFATSLYLIGLVAVWMLERKRSVLYQQMKKQVRCLEENGLMMAVLHAKNYRIMEDYRRRALGVERTKNFILENLLFINKRSSEKVSFGVF